MPTWLIVLSSIIGFIGIIVLIRRITRKSRLEREEISHQRFLRRISKWKVGDELVVYTNDGYKGAIYRTAESNLSSPRNWTEGRVKLIKWSEEEVIYETENGNTYYGDYKCINYNRSSDHRQRDGKMDNFMDSLNDKAKFREERLKKLLDKEENESDEVVT